MLVLTLQADAAEPDAFDRMDARLSALEGGIRTAALALGLPQPEPPVAQAQLFGRGNSQAISQLTARMDTVESQMRQINGQIDQIAHQIRQIEERLRRLGDDRQPRQRSEVTPGEKQAAAAPPQFSATAPQVTPDALQPGSPATGKPVDLIGIIRDTGALSDGATGTVSGQNGEQVAAILPPGATAKDAYDLAYGYIARSDYDFAEQGFRDFLNRFPDDQLAGNAQFWLGESFYRRGKFREAADAYLKVYTQFANSAKAPESLVRLGASLRQLDEKEAACATLGEFGKRYPRAPSALRKQAQDEVQRAGCT